MPTPPQSSPPRPGRGSFGPNAWLVDDLYDRYLADPALVAESWREFFADYQRSTLPAVAARDARLSRRRLSPTSPSMSRRRRCAAPPRGSSPTWRPASPFPTATSVRTVAGAALGDQPRRAERVARRARAAPSLLHPLDLLCHRPGLEQVPALNSTFVARSTRRARPGSPPRARRARARGRRSNEGRLAQPPRAGHSRRRHAGFPRIPLAYEDLVRKVHAGTSAPTTSPGRRCRSRTRARSARSSRCPA